MPTDALVLLSSDPRPTSPSPPGTPDSSDDALVA